jgi:two-component system nitrate/nitrite response regulator NarL
MRSEVTVPTGGLQAQRRDDGACLLERFPDLKILGEAESGIEALEQAHRTQPDIVLMGIYAPGYEYLQAASNIRRELPHTKVVVLTTDSSDPDLVYRAIRAGARGYLAQESGIDELVNAIRLVATGQTALAPQSLNNLVNFITEPEHAMEQSRAAVRLSAREHEVLELVARGMIDREIAERLCISESTVRSHIHNILDKLQLTNRVQAAAFVLTSRQIDGNGVGWR